MMLVARPKVTLSDVEPQVLRRFDVPLKIKLNRLHDVIKAAMGWTDSHLYEFSPGGVGWGVPDPDGYYEGPLPANKSGLLDVPKDVGTQTIHYIYDCGHNWHHVIKIEKFDDAIPGPAYPRFIRAIGALNSPPEDVGDICGYDDFVVTMADPKHEEHERMLEWYGGKFDPEEQRSAVSSTTSSASPKSGHKSRANQKQYTDLSDQLSTATAFGGC